MMTEYNESAPYRHASRRPVMAVVGGTESKRRRRAASIVDRVPARPRLCLPATTAAVLDSAAWRARWRESCSENTVGIYIAGCKGSLELGQRSGCPFPKIGSAIHVARRMVELNEERYGSVRIRDGAYVEEAGWDDWEPSRLSAQPTHPASPVRALPRELRVTLPLGVSAHDVEVLLNTAVEPISLAHLAGTPAGNALFRSRGCGLDDVLRYSPDRRAPVLATELCSFGPSADTLRLITTLEWALIRHVLAAGEEG